MRIQVESVRVESKEVKRWNVGIDDHSTSWQRNFIEHADTVYNSHLQFMKYRDIRLNLSNILRKIPLQT